MTRFGGDVWVAAKIAVMDEPGWMEVEAPAVTLRALRWDPPGAVRDAPIALCLHGFPDTARGWRFVAPMLAAAGWRVIAPFNRGYAPSTIPSDRSYHVGALMDDALRVLQAAGPTGRDVVIGHDWGAMAASGLAGWPDSPFERAVVLSVPPMSALGPMRGAGLRRSLPVLLPAQVLRSWYIQYFQLPVLPELSPKWVVPVLWRQWSPGYNATEDLRYIDAAIGSRQSWRAALGYYRALVRGRTPPEQYAALHRHWTAPTRLPLLYMHGADDGCLGVKFADRVRQALPPGHVHVVENAGHFVQLEQPDAVASRILDFIGRRV